MAGLIFPTPGLIMGAAQGGPIEYVDYEVIKSAADLSTYTLTGTLDPTSSQWVVSISGISGNGDDGNSTTEINDDASSFVESGGWSSKAASTIIGFAAKSGALTNPESVITTPNSEAANCAIAAHLILGGVSGVEDSAIVVEDSSSAQSVSATVNTVDGGFVAAVLLRAGASKTVTWPSATVIESLDSVENLFISVAYVDDCTAGTLTVTAEVDGGPMSLGLLSLN